MAAIVSLLVIVTFSVIATRIATVALVHTGLSRETSRFQARSAYMGVGFTTNESESIVNHPVRRRIIMVLMLLGNAGVVSAIASLLLTFINTTPTGIGLPYRLLILAVGLIGLWLLASSKLIDRWMSRVISRALARWTHIELRDYASLLHLAGHHQIQEINVKPGDWMANRSLRELALSDEGLIVIGIQHADGTYVGAPDGNTRIEEGDTAIVYGRDETLRNLDARRSGASGDGEHDKAVETQKQFLKRQDVQEKTRRKKRRPNVTQDKPEHSE